MTSLRSVSRFEANLLRLLYGLLQQAPLEQTLALLQKPLPRPKCLSRDAVALIQGTLAKGCIRFLARHGWTHERHLRAGKIVSGRLWQRTPPDELGLTFSPLALEFLLQLATGKLGTSVPKAHDPALGDRVLFLLAFDTLRDTAQVDVLSRWLPFFQDGLCRLAFVEELPEGKPRCRIDWQVWATGSGSAIVEALQGWLAQRWILLERKKETISVTSRMRNIGATQQRVYGEYLDALANARRWDLARCFLQGMQLLLREQPTARRWVRSLDLSKERLAERQRIYQEALSFLAQMERLRSWQQEALSVSFFDEDYPASQLWKKDWEDFHGDELVERARTLLREVEDPRSVP